MNFGRKCFDALAAERAANGKIPEERWIQIVQDLYDEDIDTMKPEKPKMVGEADEAFIKTLEAMPAYQGIDIRRELGKAQAWASVNGKAITRRRFINWINKVERPVGVNGDYLANRQPSQSLREPPGWREKLELVNPESRYVIDQRPWEDWPQHEQKTILLALSKL